MSRRIRSAPFDWLPPLLGALAFAAAGAPAPAGATTVTFDDPLEAAPYVADIGRTTAVYGEDRLLTVATQVVARPPAGWGGCMPHPAGVCVPVRMSVSWLIDGWVGGDPLQHGADARVVATPAAGQTTWTSEHWDRYDRRWTPAAVPNGSTDLDGVRWSLPLEELGLVRGPIAAGRRPGVELTVVSRIDAADAAGAPIQGLDTAGPGLLWLGALTYPPTIGPGSTPLPEGDGPLERRWACRVATVRARRIAKRIRRETRTARRRGPAARRRAARAELRRLRRELRAVQATKRRTCATASQPPSH